MSKNQRQRLLVDSRVQRSMVLHTFAHWSLFLLGTFLLLFCWQFLLGEPQPSLTDHLNAMWLRHAPVFVILVVFMPVVVYDSIKLGNRIAGPMFRLRNALHKVARGQRIQPVNFRQGDFWQELASDFNTVVARIETSGCWEAEEEPSPAAETEDSAATLANSP